MLVLFMFSAMIVHAQPSARAQHKEVESLKEQMWRAHGGKKLVDQAKSMEYSVINKNYRSTPPATTRVTYRINLKAREISASTTHEGAKIVKTIRGTEAWEEVDGERGPLSEADQEQLERVLFLNLLTLLQDSSLTYKHVRASQYKGQPVNILIVSNPLKPSQQVYLYLSKNDGKVLAFSWQKGEQENQTLYYTDLLEYTTIGHGITYPLAYQVHVNGELASEGRIVDASIKDK